MGKLKRSTRNIRWIEQHCRVPEGEHQGKPLKLRPWQKDIIRGVYDNPHGTRRAIISFPRKNGKTSLIATLMLLHLCGPEAKRNSQLYSSALSREQAAVVFKLARMMVEQSPDFMDEVEIVLSAKKLRCPGLGTEYEALSADASKAHGRSPIFIVHDELGQVRGTEGRFADLYSALETGTGAHGEPLSIVISTQAPTDDDLLSTLIDDAATGADPHVKLFLWAAPEDADPFSVETIKACNPAFGDFLNKKTVLDFAERARRLPSSEAPFRNLHLNQRVEASNPFITPTVWRANGGEPAATFGDAEVFAGLDLSSAHDLTAFVRVAWLGQEMHVLCDFWLPGEGLIDKSRNDGVPYDVWRKQGHLNTTPGASVDYDYVAPLVLAAMQRENIVKVAFDRWNFRFLLPALERAGATEDEISRFVEFGQGTKSMSPALRSLDTILLNGRMRHGQHPVLTMCAANAVAVEDPAGNRRLGKISRNRRIDGMVALAMAVAMAGEPGEKPQTHFWETWVMERKRA